MALTALAAAPRLLLAFTLVAGYRLTFPSSRASILSLSGRAYLFTS